MPDDNHEFFLKTVCLHQVIDVSNNDVTVTATSTLDDLEPRDILANGVGWEPSADSPDILHNVTIEINADDNDAEITTLTMNAAGVNNIQVVLLKDDIIQTTVVLIPTPVDPTVTIDFPAIFGQPIVGDTIVLRILEDDDPLTSTVVGDMLVEACYHPYVTTTLSVTMTTGVTGVTSVVMSPSVTSAGITTGPLTTTTAPQGWSEWSPWGDCTVTCGVGMETRVRECEAGEAYVGESPCPGQNSETVECVREDCPTTPGWTEWTPWSLCDVPCGEGEQVRYRECSNPPPLAGQTGCLGPKEEEIQCEMPACECLFDTSAFEDMFNYGPGEVIGWMEKDGVSGPTDEEELIYLGDHIGSGATIHVDCNECVCSEGSVACNATTCEDCTYAPWTEWTTCSKTCDVGQRSRSRTLVSGENQQTCTEPREEYEDCNTELCPVVEEWSTWSEWSECSTTEPCESGSRTRTRDCSGENCSGDPLDIEVCGEPCTEDNCTNGRVWTNCSFVCPQTCEDYRLVDYCSPSEACEPGCKCPDGYVTSVDGTCVLQDTCPCYTPDGVPVWPGFPYNPSNEPCKTCICSANHTLVCTEDPDCCDWDEWSSWGNCDVTCGEGTRNRYRNQISGLNCGSNVDSQPCTLDTCPPGCVHNGTEYNYGDIISDDFCEKCYCTVENSYYCVNDTMAVVDGTWVAWGQWSQCSSTCIGGTRIRTRTCSDPLPKCGGLNCPGDNTDEEPCNDVPCCELTPYSQWGECDQTCDNGTQSRNRSYVNADDALVCNEQLVDTQSCNYGNCNMSCVISEWSEWTPCSATCGMGKRSRSYNVIVPADDCPDESPEYQDCFAGDCPCLENQVWSNASLCQRTCDERFEFNQSKCVEPSEGCVCEEGLYLDDGGNCVTTADCDVCQINSTEYQPDEVFDHPEDNCYSCECVSGMVDCERKCDIPTCNAGEELSYDVPNPCCPICVPIKETCELHTKMEIVYDEVSDCITPQEVVVTYCGGGCGNSTSTSVLMLSPNAESIASECSCCGGIVEEIIPVPVVCGPSLVPQTAYMAKIGQCKCSPCVSLT